MNAMDQLVIDLPVRVRVLNRRRVAALFAICASGLRNAALEWDTRWHLGELPILDRAVAIALDYATAAEVSSDIAGLLTRLAAATPPGESRAGVSPTPAQDSWICADTAIRVIVDEAFDAGPIIEYALQAIVEDATERIYGVSDVGSEREDEAAEDILRDVKVVRAVGFVTTLIEALREAPHLDRQTLCDLATEAGVLTP